MNMRNLGLKIMGTAFALVLSTGVFAQEGMHKDHHKKGQRFEKHLDKMETELELTSDQVDRIKIIHQSKEKEIQVVNDEKLTADERREKLIAIHKQEREEVKQILTKEQQMKMQELHQKRKELKQKPETENQLKRNK
tara:strand:- start:280 stop:690 length:411 start_codon:yes stop_codon:yes gene_type:complete